MTPGGAFALSSARTFLMRRVPLKPVSPADRSRRRSCAGPSRRTRRARVEVDADARAGIHRSRLRDRRADPALLRHVAARAWKTATSGACSPVAERLERPLVRLVRGVAGNRERLEPPVRHLHRARRRAEGRQHDPDGDRPASAAGERDDRGPRASPTFYLSAQGRRLASSGAVNRTPLRRRDGSGQACAPRRRGEQARAGGPA